MASTTLPTSPPGLDLALFAAWFERACPGAGDTPLRARLLTGGRSNLTYEVTDGNNRWVVRRPPIGHVLTTAHDMAREYRVLTALRATPVPVPATYALCTDVEVLGAPFYVMEHVVGTPYRRAEQLAAVGPERTRAIAYRMADTLAALHQVDPEQVRLTDFGRPAGFLARQVRRWKQQLDASRGRPLAGIDELHERLATHQPATTTATVVHGDYRLDNLLVDANDEVAAVIDWEMATVADPLTDVGLFVVYQRLGELGAGHDITDVDSAAGYPRAHELLGRYAQRSGRDLSDLGFYVALAYFKLAVILEGIHYRHGLGQTVGTGFERVGALVEPLVRAGLTSIKEHI